MCNDQHLFKALNIPNPAIVLQRFWIVIKKLAFKINAKIVKIFLSLFKDQRRG